MDQSIEDIIRRIIREELQAIVAELPVVAPPVREAPDPRWLTAAEAGVRVRRHENTVRRALEAGELHGSQSGKGGRWKVRPVCVDAWVDGRPCAHMADRGEWLTPTGAAEYLSVSEGTLANWRSDRTGPKFARQGRVIRYRHADLDAWIEMRA